MSKRNIFDNYDILYRWKTLERWYLVVKSVEYKINWTNSKQIKNG